MLLNTSNNEAMHRRLNAQAAKQAQMKTWITEQEANCIADLDPESNPTDILSRIGKPMHENAFEAKLKVLNPSLIFQWNEFNSTKKAMYRATPKGPEYLFPYDSGLMPERSIMAVEEEMVPDAAVFTPGFVIERKEFKPDGTNPYYRKVKKVWNEKQRGWRTVLIKLVKCGLLTPTQVETAFGAANTKEWQGHLGKTAVTTPW